MNDEEKIISELSEIKAKLGVAERDIAELKPIVKIGGKLFIGLVVTLIGSLIALAVGVPIAIIQTGS